MTLLIFFILLNVEEYLNDKHAIITFVGNKTEDAWLPNRQISLRYAREVAHHWDTGCYHINTRCKIDLFLPLLYLARRIIKVDELVTLPPCHQKKRHYTRRFPLKLQNFLY